MQENEELDLFDRAHAGANDWQVVDASGAETPAEAEKPAAPAAVPQIWDDISREDPAPKAPAEVMPPEPPPAEEVLPAEEALPAKDVQPEIIEEIPAPAEAVVPAPEVAEPLPVASPEPAADADGVVSRYRHVAPAEISTLAEMGRYLATMRKNANLSPEEVSEATKIRGDYLDAIENGDASELPQAVYVLAYIRKLCELYSIDTVNLNNFFEDLRDGFSYELPEDINKSIVGHENDEEQQKKMRQLAIGLISAAAIVLVALVVGIVTLIVSFTGGDKSQACTISDRKIIEYQGKPALYLQKLPPNR